MSVGAGQTVCWLGGTDGGIRGLNNNAKLERGDSNRTQCLVRIEGQELRINKKKERRKWRLFRGSRLIVMIVVVIVIIIYCYLMMMMLSKKEEKEDST